MNEPRTYRGVQDIVTGEVFLVYAVNGTSETLHVSAECRDDAEAKTLLASLNRDRDQKAGGKPCASA